MTRNARNRSTGVALLLCLLIATPGYSASKKELAAQAYRAGAKLYEDLKQVPKLELGVRQYELVISKFETVHRTSPASGYADDALLALGEIYEAMYGRFQEERYRQKAVATYEFAAREYPHSKHRRTALAAAARLSNTRAPVTASASAAPSSPPPAASAGTRNLALSDSEHKAGETVRPPGSNSSSKKLVPVAAIRHHSYDDGTRIVLEMGAKTPLKYDRLRRPERLYIDLFGSQMAQALIRGVQLQVDDTLLATARLAQNRGNKARLVLDLRRSVAFDAFWLSEPTRLVIDIRSADLPRAERTLLALSSSPATPDAPRAASTTADGKHSLTRALGLKLDRILVDAGHGGHDTGSIGPGGLREKDVVLDISKRLGKLLNQRMGAEVIYTRQKDEFIPLEERSNIANQRGADLMISIHCNAAPTSKVRGIETYYLSFTSDPWELSVASLENAAAESSINELQDLVAKIALDDKIEESREFASKVQSRLHRGVAKHSSSIRDRGIRKAPFVVLIGAKMPAVLVEIGFISNRTDEGLMRKSSFRQEVAEHLFQGISEYASSLGATTLRTSLSPGSAQRD